MQECHDHEAGPPSQSSRRLGAARNAIPHIFSTCLILLLQFALLPPARIKCFKCVTRCRIDDKNELIMIPGLANTRPDWIIDRRIIQFFVKWVAFSLAIPDLDFDLPFQSDCLPMTCFGKSSKITSIIQTSLLNSDEIMSWRSSVPTIPVYIGQELSGKRDDKEAVRA